MKNKFIFAAIALFVLRVLVGRLVGVTVLAFASGDDTLLLNYSRLENHFLNENHSYEIMVKEIGFPVFVLAEKYRHCLYRRYKFFVAFGGGSIYNSVRDAYTSSAK